MQLDKIKPSGIPAEPGEHLVAAHKSIVVVDESATFRRLAEKRLLTAGYTNYRVYSSMDSFTWNDKESIVDLLIIDVDRNSDAKFRLVETSDTLRVNSLIPSGEGVHLDVIERAVRAGADDFLVKTRHLDIVREIQSLVLRGTLDSFADPHSSSIFRSSFIRCVGLSEFEIVLLKAFCPTFPSQKELAFQLSRSDSYIRKIFSNIYRKLNVTNSAQLANLLTLCCLLGSSRKRWVRG